MNTPPITKEPATMTTKPAADTFRLARRLAKTLGFDGVQTTALAFSHDGTDYIITRGTGEGDFAYDASDVDGWLEHLGRERASYSEDFCQALTPVADVELAWAVLQEEGFALCREGDCRAVLAGERCERGSEDDIRRGTIQVMSGARAEILWDGDETPSIWTFPPALRPAQGEQFATVGSNGVELVVWGLGLSREAAEADADETLAQTVGERPELVTVPCSPATAELIRGGAIGLRDDSPARKDRPVLPVWRDSSPFRLPHGEFDISRLERLEAASGLVADEDATHDRASTLACEVS